MNYQSGTSVVPVWALDVGIHWCYGASYEYKDSSDIQTDCIHNSIISKSATATYQIPFQGMFWNQTNPSFETMQRCTAIL